MFSIKTYNDSYKVDWNNFVDISKNSTFLFKREFMDYHAEKFEDYSLLIFYNSDLETYSYSLQKRKKLRL